MRQDVTDLDTLASMSQTGADPPDNDVRQSKRNHLGYENVVVDMIKGLLTSWSAGNDNERTCRWRFGDVIVVDVPAHCRRWVGVCSTAEWHRVSDCCVHWSRLLAPPRFIWAHDTRQTLVRPLLTPHHINKVKLRRATLVLGSVTTCGGYTIPVFSGHSGALCLAIPPWVVAMSTGDGFGHSWGRNGDFCVVVCHMRIGLLTYWLKSIRSLVTDFTVYVESSTYTARAQTIPPRILPSECNIYFKCHLLTKMKLRLGYRPNFKRSRQLP